MPQQVSNNDQIQALSNDQLIAIGELLLQNLITIIHKGVVEKTFIGFQFICRYLFKSESHVLNHVPQKWLLKLLDSTNSDIFGYTRRSAGLPFGIRAILRTEAGSILILIITFFIFTSVRFFCRSTFFLFFFKFESNI